MSIIGKHSGLNTDKRNLTVKGEYNIKYVALLLKSTKLSLQYVRDKNTLDFFL